MKKFLTKVVPVALVVLAICMTSISTAAAMDATYADGVVTVTTGTTSEVTVLATRQNGSGLNANLASEDVWRTIVYIDQAETDAFNFVPREGIEGDTVTVFMGGQGASTIEKKDVTVVTIDRTLTLNANGGTIVGEVPAAYPAEGYTLPAVTKAGYTFGGWYADETFIGEAVTAIPANEAGPKAYYASWILNATTTHDAGYYAPEEGIMEGEDVGGVISVTATFKSHVTNITKYGFYVYRTDSSTPIVDESEVPTGKVDISAVGNESAFYTIVYGIPYNCFDDDVIILPYVVADGKVVFGETTSYTVNGAADESLKYLGTKTHFEGLVD